MAVSITVNEASRGVYAAWRLLRCDRGAVSLLDDTLEGVVKSYWCAALILPFYGLFLLLEAGVPVEHLGSMSNLAAKAGLMNALIGEAVFYVLAWWVVWPLIMDRVAPWLGRDENYFRYIVAFNWSHSVRIGLLVVYMAMRYGGMIPGDMLVIVQLSLLLLLCAYHWFLLRNVLETDGGTAVGLVAAEYAMMVILNNVAISAAV